MLKILQVRLQKYMNCELPDVQAEFRKGNGTRDQIANILWIIKKAKFPGKKKIYFCFIDYPKAFDCGHFSSVSQSCPSLILHHSQPYSGPRKLIFLTCITPGARNPGVQNQVGLKKHHYEQS